MACLPATGPARHQNELQKARLLLKAVKLWSQSRSNGPSRECAETETAVPEVARHLETQSRPAQRALPQGAGVPLDNSVHKLLVVTGESSYCPAGVEGCVLFCVIKPILGNRYGPGASSGSCQVSLFLSFFLSWVVLGDPMVFWVLVCYAATPLTLPVHQERIRMVQQ